MHHVLTLRADSMSETENNLPPVQPENPVLPKRRPWWKRLMRIFFWTSGIFVFLLIVLAILTYVYQDEVKKYVMAEINSRSYSKIIVEPKDIDLTIIRTFPNVTVEIKNIAALDATTSTKRDTLLKAGKLSFAFNILDLWRANYNIHNISLEDAVVKIWVDEKGKDNYHFLKESSDSGKVDTSHVNFALQNILLKNVLCNYSDKKKKNFYIADFHEMNFSGDFGTEKYELGTDGDFTIKKILTDGHSYFKDDNGSVNLLLEIDNSKGTYIIKKAKLKIAEFGLIVSGNLAEQTIGKRKKYFCDLAVKGDDIDLPGALSLLSSSYKSNLNGLQSTGEFYVDGTIKGLYSDSTTPDINASFGIRDGATISRENTSVKLTNVTMTGLFSNEKGKEGLQVNSFNASSAQSKFSGEFTMTGFSHPHYDANLSGKIDLNEMQTILQIDSIETISGVLDIHLSASGSPAKGNSLSASDFRAFKTSGVAEISGASFKLRSSQFPVDSISGKFSFDGNNVAVNGFTAQAAGSDVHIDGTVKNLLGYLFLKKEVLAIDGKFLSNNLDLNSLLTASNSTATKSDADTIYHFVLPQRLKLNLETSVKHVLFRKFEANDISGNVQMYNRRLIADPLSFDAMDGSFTGSGMIDGTAIDSLLITCNADIKNVNIYKLFYQCEDFGEGDSATISYHNVRSGLVTSHVDFASLWGNDLNINENKIYTNADISISNGELVDFKPLYYLSRFIKLDDLKDIRFKSLENNIEIKNRVIHIPKMEINSSALNVTMSGTHSFDDTVNYHFIVDMDEIRAKKAKAAKPQNTEFGVEENDGGHRTRLFITMKGYIDNPDIRYDTKGAVQAVKEDLHAEKQNLKSILHDEFGWFKDDGSKKDKDNKKDDKDKKFILQSDDTLKHNKKKKGDDNLDDGDDYH
jgi:uncharacterized protein involved in outer membrane biogenesis